MTTATIVQPRLRLEDPHDCTDANDVLCVFDAFFDGLVRFGKDGGYSPAIAESWIVSRDARDWTFVLRENLLFHDGSDCDATAVILSLRRMARADKGYTLGAPGVWHQYLGDAQISAPDRRTVKIALTHPMADLLDVLVYGYVIAPAALERYERGDATTPIGTGPYRFETFTEGYEITGSRFEGWHGARPANAGIRFLLEPDASRRQNMLLAGNAQVANSLGSQQSCDLDDTGGHTRIVSLVPVSIIYLFNSASGPFADPRVRRATNLALDRNALVETVVGGAARPLLGFVSPSHFGAEDSALDMSRDLAEAKRLLIDAGHGGGLVINVDCPTRLPDEAEALTAAIGLQLADIGISFRVHRHEDREAYAHGVRLKKVHDMCVFDSSPLSTFRVLAEKIDARTRGSWWLGYHNGEVERLIDEGRRTTDNTARAAIYASTYRLLQQDPPWLYLYNPLRVTGLAGKHPQWRMRPDAVLDVTMLPDFGQAADHHD
ncbi:peptide ABC transporter substrate-binding protein [Ensifer sp. HO-A22]|uniref:Peptide ABC transporter substrate-binding protein n=1 Tax=Ensifer oleiphilus TaxID=2742698 RepID=A0A7Y6UQ88_9HYPH|nr:ABC transporter substrate-binding protein [Ensifer oleiphilus]NVD41774.1 peptide ABC transporter substrate-binding protein [Ensifer oleiphilus]